MAFFSVRLLPAAASLSADFDSRMILLFKNQKFQKVSCCVVVCGTFSTTQGTGTGPLEDDKIENHEIS